MDERTDRPPQDRTVKVPHLVMALLFLGTVAVWALVAGDAIGADEVAFLVPGVLVAAGVLGLLASLASGRNRRRRQSLPTPAAPHAADLRDDDPWDEPDPHDDRHDDGHDDGHDDLEHTAPLTPTSSTTPPTNAPTTGSTTRMPTQQPEEHR